MQQSEVREFLSVRVGTEKPIWSLSRDSNALHLAKEGGPAVLAVAMDAAQAEQVRAIGIGVERICVGLIIGGETLQLHLVGRRINDFKWAGVGSADPRVKVSEQQLESLTKQGPDNVVRIRSKKFG